MHVLPLRRFVAGTLVFLFPLTALAATRTWDAGGSDNNWSTAANWSDDTVPKGGDIILFDGTGKKNSTVDAAFGGSGAELRIGSSNTGTITVGRALTVNGNLSLSGGTLAINGGNTVTVKGSWQNGGGTFTAGTGTVLLAGTGSHTLKETASLYNVNINDGLVGYWPFDNGSGLSATDKSGYGNNGTLEEGPTWSADPTNDINFANPYALSFDGTDDYVDFGSISLGTQHSLSWWMNYQDSGDGIIVGGDSDKYFAYIDGPNSSTHKIYYSPGYSPGFPQDRSVIHGGFTSGVWYSMTIIRDGLSVRFYKNGVQIGTVQTLAADNPITMKYIGKEQGGYFFEGLLDDLRIYNRALSSTEVARLAAGNQPQTTLGTYTLGAALDVEGSLTLAAGTLDVSSSNYAITASGSWLNYGGVFTPRSGTVKLDGASSTVQTGGSSFSTLTLRNGLVGYWNFDEGSGTAAVDSSVEGNDGTLINGPTWSAAPDNSISFTNPYALSFDGVDDYIGIDADSSHNAPSNRTLSAWVNLSGDPTAYSTIIHKAVDDVNIGYSLHVHSDRKAQLWIADGTDWAGVTDATTTISDGAWFHLAGVADGSTIRLYVNGTQEGSTVSQGQPGNSVGVDLNIGRRRNPADRHFKGLIDDVRIYNRALSAAEVASLAAGNALRSTNTLYDASTVSTAITIGPGSTLSLTPYTLTATLASITNSGIITEGAGAIIHTSSITASPSSLDIGSSIAITLTDSDANVDATARETVTVTANGETVTLTETTNTSGVFTGSVATAHGGGVASNGVIENDDACSFFVNVVYADPQNGTDRATARVTVTDSGVPCEIGGGGGGGGRDVQQLIDQAAASRTSGGSASSVSSSASAESSTHTAGTRSLFSDVPTDAWFFAAVQELASLGVISGYKDAQGNALNRFGPADPVTFAEALKMTIGVSGADVPPGGIPTDTALQGHWSAAYLSYAQTLGLSVFPTAATIDLPVSRGKLAQLLVDILKPSSSNDGTSFTDVSASHEHAMAIRIVAAQGWMMGDTDADGTLLHRFRPDDSLNRAEVAQVLMRVLR